MNIFDLSSELKDGNGFMFIFTGSLLAIRYLCFRYHDNRKCRPCRPVQFNRPRQLLHKRDHEPALGCRFMLYEYWGNPRYKGYKDRILHTHPASL